MTEEWKFVKEIGAGGFGVVWLEETEMKQLRAVKRMTLMESTSKGMNFKRELQILVALENVSCITIGELEQELMVGNH